MTITKLRKRVSTELDVARGCWSTASEKAWLNGLGTHRRNSPPKAIALAKYIENSKKRTDWGMINKEEVLAYANELLQEAT